MKTVRFCGFLLQKLDFSDIACFQLVLHVGLVPRRGFVNAFWFTQTWEQVCIRDCF